MVPVATREDRDALAAKLQVAPPATRGPVPRQLVGLPSAGLDGDADAATWIPTGPQVPAPAAVR